MSKGSTATTSTGPASYLGQDYGNLANAATNLYSTTAPAYYPGNQVAPFSPLQEEGFGSIQNAATAPNTIGQSGQGYFNALESGSLLNPATNPSLEGMAQLADNQIQNNLASQFAGSGRNIEASAPVQASQMANVASDIYGGAYNNTMNNMTSGLGQASQLTSQQFMPGQALLGAGGQIQNQAQNMIGANQNQFGYYQTLPFNQLNNYASVLGGMPGSTQNTPYYTNAAAGGLGGALAGAQLGSSLGASNGWTGALSALGGLAGAFG